MAQWMAGRGFKVASLGVAGWSAKVEYLFVDLGKVSINALDIDGFPFHVDYRARDHILRFGLNWHFDTPVVAKY